MQKDLRPLAAKIFDIVSRCGGMGRKEEWEENLESEVYDERPESTIMESSYVAGNAAAYADRIAG